MSPDHIIDRRCFLAATGSALAAGSWLSAAPQRARADDADKMIKKAVKYGMVQAEGTMLDKFRLVKDLGFDGIELDSPNNFSLDEVLAARDTADLRIHGVVDSVHWRDTLSHPDAAVRARGVAALETALRDAKSYGATSVLLVPAVVNKEVSYDDAYTRSQTEIRKVLPLAHELGVIVAIENVWNHFLLSPLETARYIDEFESPMVRAHFDVGNVVNYGWPEQWIRILDNRIVKLDIKEFSRKRRDDDGLWRGFDVKLGDGDCDWPAVTAALREIGYRGWGSAEVPGGGRERLAEIADRMDRIFAV